MPPRPAPNHASDDASAGTERAPPVSAAMILTRSSRRRPAARARCRRSRLARLARRRPRRHRDGPGRGPLRRALDRHVRRVMIALGLAISASAARLGQTWQLYHRPRAVHRPDRQCRPQCAALCLCQPLVRQAARLGAGADLERAIHRGRALAADLRAGDRRLWLAADHDHVRPVPGRRSSSRSRSIFLSARPKSCRRRSPRAPARAKARPCSAGRPTWCSAC